MKQSGELKEQDGKRLKEQRGDERERDDGKVDRDRLTGDDKKEQQRELQNR